MTKDNFALKTIGEVSESLELPQHVLRFWEKKFSVIQPIKKNKGRRYYTSDQIEILKHIKFLLHEKQYSIKGAQKVILEEKRSKSVSSIKSEKPNLDEIIHAMKKIRVEIDKIFSNGV